MPIANKVIATAAGTALQCGNCAAMLPTTYLTLADDETRPRAFRAVVKVEAFGAVWYFCNPCFADIDERYDGAF